MRKTYAITLRQLELCHLKTPLEGCRVKDRKAVAKLAASLERHGQRVPIIVTGRPEEPESWNVLDGHQRVAATRLLKHDTIEAQLWDCSLARLS